MTPVDDHYVVVRRRGEWLLAPVPPRDPVVVTIDDVVARLRSGAGALPVRSRSEQRPVAAPEIEHSQVVEPVWSLVGLVAEGHVLVGHPEGGHVLLDETDVRIIDGVGGPRPLADLDARALGIDPEALAGRCRQLVDAGCLRPVAARVPVDEVATTPPTVPVTIGPVRRPEPVAVGVAAHEAGDPTPHEGPAHRARRLVERAATRLTGRGGPG